MLVTDFEFFARHNVLDYPEYHFEIEELRRGSEQMLLAHIRVHKWSKEVFKDIVTKWRILRECVTAPLFAFAEVEDAKFIHFVRLLGFKPVSQIVLNDGSPRQLFIHVKDCPDGVFTTANQERD